MKTAFPALILVLLLSPVRARALEWSWQNPLPQGNWINDLWVAADGTVYAAGRRGTALRYQEGVWDFLTGYSDYEYRGVWGDGAGKVYFAGSYLDGAQWRGVIAAYDGESWNELTHTATYVTDIWGSSPDDIFVTGPSTSVLHYDGVSWTHLSTGGSFTLNSVWGSSPGNVFAVGFNGRILRYDGISWAEMASPTANQLLSVWGFSGEDVYAGGELGTLLHYDGISWSEIELPGWGAVRGIWGRGGDDIRLAGDFGEIHRFDGQDWTLETNPARVDLRAAGGSGGRAAVGGRAGLVMISDNGGPWEAVAGDPDPPNIKAFWGAGPDNVFAVGGYFYGKGKELHGPVFHFDGTSWTEQTRVKEELFSVWGTGEGEVFAGGNDGTILHYDGADWTVMTIGSTTQIRGFWGGSGTDVFAVGGYFYMDDGIRSAILIWHYDGEEWTVLPSPGSGEPILRGIWGDSPNDIFAVGGYSYQGQYQHAVYRYDGELWSEINTGLTNYLTGVWGSGPDDVYAIPYAGRIIRYDGSSWAVAPNSPEFANLDGIWGSGRDDIYAVGNNGRIWHHDGDSWSRLPSPTGQDLNAVWLPSAGDVFLAGMEGAILRGREEGTSNLTPTPSPSPSLTPTPSNTPTATATPTASPSPTPSLTPTPSATPSCSPTVTPSVTPSLMPTPSATPTPSVAPTVTPSPFPLPRFSRWYLPAGATSIGGLDFDTYILISNPNQHEVTARLRFADETGEIERIKEKIPAGARRTVKLNNHVPGDRAGVSTIVYSLDESPIVCERAMYWSSGEIGWIGGHNSIGLSETANRWKLAEGATHLFDCFVHVLNPSKSDSAEVTVTFSGRFGHLTEITGTVTPSSNWTIPVNDLVGSVDQVSVLVSGDRPLAVDRTMYWGGGGYRWVDGHSTTGVSAAAGEWILAEGATHLFDQYVLVFNPDEERTAELLFLFLDGEGETKQHRRDLAPRARYTVRVNDYAPDHPGLSTVVRSLNGVEIIAERAMYWPRGGPDFWLGGHGSVGSKGAAFKWHLPEGATHLFDEYLLVFNTAEGDLNWTTVKFTFSFADGSFTSFTDLVGPQSRYTVNVADRVGRRDQVSARVESLDAIPITAERAMYWPPGGPWTAGHATVGVGE